MQGRANVCSDQQWRNNKLLSDRNVKRLMCWFAEIAIETGCIHKDNHNQKVYTFINDIRVCHTQLICWVCSGICTQTPNTHSWFHILEPLECRSMTWPLECRTYITSSQLNIWMNWPLPKSIKNTNSTTLL